MYSLNILGIGVGFHRLFSHNAFKAKAPVRVALGILGSMAAQGPALYWAAIHRRHHAFSDREGDPHSPYFAARGNRKSLRGFWHAHVGWLFDPEVHDFAVFVPDLLRDRALFLVHSTYFLWIGLGLALPAGIGYIAGGWRGAAGGFLWGGLVRIALTHHVTWSVNSLCHMYGSRPFRSKDLSRNNVLLALAAFGEGWHNNHHSFPSSAFHGLHWWQIDISGYVIRLLRATGLAWSVRRPSPEMMADASVARRPNEQ
jgi:stearoyl-CoA desaturase (delta-9 desaturase)